MELIETGIEGLVVLEPRIHGDSRGYFFESWTARDFSKLIGDITFVQENQSRSSRGVVRGLHFQRPPHSQAKLVRVVEGSVLDVAVDLRSDSPTYGKWHAVELSADNCRQLFIPRGFAHGFAVLSENATFIYKCDNYYAPLAEDGIMWNDPTLAIDWKVKPADAVLSSKDLDHQDFNSFKTPF